MKFIREAFVCRNQAFPPKYPVPFLDRGKQGLGYSIRESKEHDWLKHVRKYNYYHSHKSAEKVTWQITQIGNRAGCLSWQWPIRKIKDEWKIILIWFFFYFSMLYLELQGLAGEKRYKHKRSQDWRDEMSKRVSQCLSFNFLSFIYFVFCPILVVHVGLWNGVDWMVGFVFYSF